MSPQGCCQQFMHLPGEPSYMELCYQEFMHRIVPLLVDALVPYLAKRGSPCDNQELYQVLGCLLVPDYTFAPAKDMRLVDAKVLLADSRKLAQVFEGTYGAKDPSIACMAMDLLLKVPNPMMLTLSMMRHMQMPAQAVSINKYRTCYKESVLRVDCLLRDTLVVQSTARKLARRHVATRVHRVLVQMIFKYLV